MLVKLTIARFVVEQNMEILWSAGANVTYSAVLHDNGWDLDISTGVFSPLTNGTFVFVLSGTALKTDSELSMITKSGEIVTTEEIFQTTAGVCNLKENPYQILVYNSNRYR
jgi:hypothetical protein